MAGGSSSRLADQLRFLKNWATAPLKTGAVAPSGPHLTRAMAAAADEGRDGSIVELGPGTGVVTEALLARGLAPERLVLVEYSADFAALLRARFPGATVVEGDAYALPGVVAGHVNAPLAAVVSSLPLFTSPEEKRIALAEAAFGLLSAGAPFVQFSYALVSPVPDRVPGMRTEVSGWIWRNVPPARVWTYRRG
jgi:phosphatidylethanolamine/phosphatidyl-N-methylethanolamine N-methyltransferase